MGGGIFISLMIVCFDFFCLFVREQGKEREMREHEVWWEGSWEGPERG